MQSQAVADRFAVMHKPIADPPSCAFWKSSSHETNILIQTL